MNQNNICLFVITIIVVDVVIISGCKSSSIVVTVTRSSIVAVAILLKSLFSDAFRSLNIHIIILIFKRGLTSEDSSTDESARSKQIENYYAEPAFRRCFEISFFEIFVKFRGNIRYGVFFDKVSGQRRKTSDEVDIFLQAFQNFHKI